MKPFHSNSLAEAMAAGMSTLTWADVAVVFPQQLQNMQSPIDGTAFAYIAAGEIQREADVLRAVPFVGDVIDQSVLVFEKRPVARSTLCSRPHRATGQPTLMSP